MDDVAELADRVVALDHGAVAASGTPRDLFLNNSDLLPGIPDALAFSRVLASQGAQLASEPLTLDELVEEVLHGRTR